jgi:hypothetical protein
MIAYSAKNVGMSLPRLPIEALTYRTENVRLINENLSDPEMRLSDGNFLAVVGAIAYYKETTPKVCGYCCRLKSVLSVYMESESD